jgi:peptidoglycan/xylan/chitin deacetylase (PgdA/CDA1 family)
MKTRNSTWESTLRDSLIYLLLLLAMMLYASFAYAGLGANLIPNPSLETGTSTPTQWQSVKSGTATVQFAYPVAGTDGAKAAKVTASAYTSGDEYWQPPIATVTAGKQYQFTGYANSSAAVPIIATYTKSGGGKIYATLGTSAGTNTWQKFTTTLTVPANVVNVRIQHVLQAKGTMAIDNYSLQEITADNTPPTCTVSASPASITAGGTTTLTFSSTNATGGTIDQGVGGVGASGTKVVTPSATTTYTGTFTGANGATGLCAATVSVTAAVSKPVISSFTGTPASISQGQSSTLAWSVSGASSLSINGSTVSGTSQVMTPNTTTNYVLTATNAGGSVTASQTVTVITAPPPTCTLTANPTSITSGSASTLTLASTNATSATTNFGLALPNGSLPVSPTATTTYTATVTGSGGTGSCNVNVTVTTPPPSSNMLQNGNFESADPSSPSTPLNWASSVWDATATFSYPVTGNGSGKAAKVTTTQVNAAAFGGASWSFPHVNVSSHTVYQYTSDFMSNVTTNVSMEYLHTNGSYSYEWVNQPPATGSSWQHQTINISVPTDVVSFTVVHGLGSVGSLTVDNASLVAMPASPFASGMVTLVYDDGYTSQYTSALPMLKAAGLPATFAIITSYPAALDPEYMTWAQIKDLKASGFEISAHTRTHPSLTSLSNTQAQQEIQGAVSDLTAQGLTPTTFVYPYGDENPAIEQMVKAAGPMGARGSYFGLNAPFSNHYAASDIRLDATSTLAGAKQAIDQAIADKRWLVFELHGVANAGDDYTITPTLMQNIINYIKSSGIKAVTLEQGMKLLNP